MALLVVAICTLTPFVISGACARLCGATPRVDTNRDTHSKCFIGSLLFDRNSDQMVYGFAPPREAVARVPPRPMVSTAVEGTITIAPFSLTASYSMFMARRCRATGFSA